MYLKVEPLGPPQKEPKWLLMSECHLPNAKHNLFSIIILTLNITSFFQLLACVCNILNYFGILSLSFLVLFRKRDSRVKTQPFFWHNKNWVLETWISSYVSISRNKKKKKPKQNTNYSLVRLNLVYVSKF